MRALHKILIFLGVVSLTILSRCNRIDSTVLHDIKIDSLIKEMAGADAFPNSKIYPTLINSDVKTNLNEYVPLTKKVYYPDIDLTIEYRKINYSHDNVEFIICYNQSGFAAIPFYWQYDVDGRARFVEDFEAKLNEAILFFFRNQQTNTNYSFYQKIFTNRILENISAYRFHQANREDLKFQIVKVDTLINKGLLNYDSARCRSSALENLQKHSDHKSDNDYDFYIFPINQVLFRFEYTDKGVQFLVINEDCFWQLVF